MVQSQIGVNVQLGATALADARLNARVLDDLPIEGRPLTVEDAYHIQAKLHEILTERGYGKATGHKIGCTTRVMQEYLNIPSPCAGKLFDHTVQTSHGEYQSQDLCNPGVECEIAVRLSADLVVESTDQDDVQQRRARVAHAVGTAMASIELVDSRWVDFTQQPAATLIADDFFGAGCVLGEEQVIDPLTLDQLTGRMSVNGTVVGQGRGSDILGHPLDALAWLADLRQLQGQPLREGEFVTLGSVVKTEWLTLGDRVEIVIDGLGTASLTVV